MNRLHIIFILLITSVTTFRAQVVVNDLPGDLKRCTVENGDTVILVKLRDVYCFPRRKFKNRKQEQHYWRDVNDVKKTLPLAKLIKGIMIETYEYIETLPTQKERDAHLKRMQNELFEEYKPVLKKLNYRQGKLLIRLIDRECHSSSFALVKAYLGGFAANFWNGFGRLFGVNMKSQWDPKGKDKELEEICILVEYGAV